MMIPPRAQVSSVEPWPELPLPDWQDTYATLHLWTQIVGKIRLAQTPWTNHSWHVPFYVAARGLTTSPMPYGARVFQIDFDFIHHRLFIHASDGGYKSMALASRSVADFHSELFAHLAESLELCSCVFWPGVCPAPYPLFYAYAYPVPANFYSHRLRARDGVYEATLREFVLPYDAVREAVAPDAVLLDFLQDTYEAAADLGKWDRAALEQTRARE